jgi:hypothetical protein
MFKNRNVLLVFLASLFSSELSMAHTGLEAGSMMHISLHASLAIGLGAVLLFAGALVIRKMKKARIKK